MLTGGQIQLIRTFAPASCSTSTANMARFGWPRAMPSFGPVIVLATLLLVALTGADETSPTPQATPMATTLDSGAAAFAAFSAVAARRSPLDIVALYADDANIVSWNAATGTGSRYNGTHDIINFWEEFFVFFDPEVGSPLPWPGTRSPRVTVHLNGWACSRYVLTGARDAMALWHTFGRCACVPPNAFNFGYPAFGPNPPPLTGPYATPYRNLTIVPTRRPGPGMRPRATLYLRNEPHDSI